PGNTFCALAPGAMEPLQSGLKYFMHEFEEHVNRKCCPYKHRYGKPCRRQVGQGRTSGSQPCWRQTGQVREPPAGLAPAAASHSQGIVGKAGSASDIQTAGRAGQRGFNRRFAWPELSLTARNTM